MKNLNDILRPIAAELQRFEAFFGQTLRADTEPMDSIMRYVLESDGKRLRPALVLLSAKLLGEPNEQTLRAATFVEMVHTATLIHDDIVDGSDWRRGKASVKAHFGSLSSVLAGDYLLSKAMLLISDSADHAILKEMLHTAAAMSEGELMQNALVGQTNVHPTNAYLDIITRKTAMLMRSCCLAGACSVNATPEQVEQITEFGLNFGILFQLRDDLLDADSTENVRFAQSLLPDYLQKTLDALMPFPASETLGTLKALTLFCAQREH